MFEDKKQTFFIKVYDIFRAIESVEGDMNGIPK